MVANEFNDNINLSHVVAERKQGTAIFAKARDELDHSEDFQIGLGVNPLAVGDLIRPF